MCANVCARALSCVATNSLPLPVTTEVHSKVHFVQGIPDGAMTCHPSHNITLATASANVWQPRLPPAHPHPLLPHVVPTPLPSSYPLQVLHHGEVREVGSHADLLATGGLYATLWNKQAGAGGTAIDTNDDDNAIDLDAEVAAPEPGQGASPSPALPPGSSTDSTGAVQGIPTPGADGGAQATTGKGKKKGGGKKH